jgi:oxygen-dependent protoporphyrinogen oxidase
MATVVVGGGIAGLATGYALGRRGEEVVVLEAAPCAGGLVATHVEGGYVCEAAASGWQVGEEGGVHDLARELGLELLPAAKAARQRYVYRHGALRTVPVSPPALFGSGLLSMSGKLRLLAEPFVPRGHAQGESVAAFFRRRIGAEATLALADPFTTGVFAGDAETLELSSAFPSLAALEAAHGSLFFGMLARRRGAKESGMWAPKQGVGALAAALATALGPSLHTSVRIRALSFEPGGVRVDWAEGSRVAERVVLALPAPEAARLLAPHDAELAEALTRIRYVGMAVVHVGFAQGDLQHPLDGFGFLVARGEAPRCLGCAFESSLWPQRAPEGQALLRLFYGGARDPGVLELSDAELTQLVRADLRRVGIASEPPTFLRIVRHARAIPQYELGHAARIAKLEARAAELRVSLVGNPYHGVSLDAIARFARVP